MELDDWVSLLQQAGCKPKRSGAGYKALCPAHEDRNPSLSISAGDHQPVVVNCFAGCTSEAIEEALGIATRGDPVQLARHVARKPRPAPPAKQRKPQPIPTGPGLRHWTYTDQNGTPVMVSLRRDTATGKRFSQWTPTGDGWVPENPGVEGAAPLYRLPTIMASTGAVSVVEGEKCVDACLAAWPHAQAVTTWIGGGGAWRNTDWYPAVRSRGISARRRR